MEARERQYGIESFDSLKSSHLKNENMGIFVDIQSGPIRSPSPSGSDPDLAIRRSVDEELALTDDSDDEIPASSSSKVPLHARDNIGDRRIDDRRSQTPDILPVLDEHHASPVHRLIEVSDNSDSDQESSSLAVPSTRYLSDDEDDDSEGELETNRIINEHNNSMSHVAILPVVQDDVLSNGKPCRVRSISSSSSDTDEEVVSPNSCRFCSKSFRSKADLERHIRCHTGERPYSCDNCGKSFSQSSHLQRHLLTHPDRLTTHKCALCEKTFAQKIQLVGHMAVHGKKDPITKVKTKFKCDYCQKTFDLHHKYRNHMVAHISGNLHICDVCGRSFKMNSYLIVHKRTHTQTKVYTGDRPFACKLCGKAFLSSSNLDLHATIHKYERTSFPCEVCGKDFSRKSNYVAHAKSHYR